VVGEGTLDEEQRAGPEDHRVALVGLGLGEAAGQVVGGDDVVDRVGLDVLVEVVRGCRAAGPRGARAARD
jgi:hypothetical protein